MTLELRDFKAGDVVRLSPFGANEFPTYLAEKYNTKPWVVVGVENQQFVRVQIPNYEMSPYPFLPKELEFVKRKNIKPIKWI